MKRTKSFENNYLLYLIATPIGNLKEMTPRALEIISKCDLVVAEDTRNASSLLAKFDIKKPAFSLHEHNEREASKKVVNDILSGKKVVYMSDAGYPAISDPGHILVEECLKNDIAVSSVAGSSAFINALVASGLDSDHFYFYGFLSSKESEAKKQLETLLNKEETIIFYESPHRIANTLKLLSNVLGERKCVIARELTKLNEEFIRGTLSELANIDASTLIGEMVIVVEGNKIETKLEDAQIINYLTILLNKGLTKKDAIEVTSILLKVNKNYVYDLAKSL